MIGTSHHATADHTGISQGAGVTIEALWKTHYQSSARAQKVHGLAHQQWEAENSRMPEVSAGQLAELWGEHWAH